MSHFAYTCKTEGVGLGSSQWVRSADLRQLLMWWLNSPWAPGHFCGVLIVIVVVVVLLFWFSCRDSPDKGSVLRFGR